MDVSDRLSDEIEDLVFRVIGTAIAVHSELGPGYLEKIYESAMSMELNLRNIPHVTQASVPIVYKGTKLHGQVLDMVIDDKIVVELKAVDQLTNTHEAQLLSYLKSTGIQAGLLLNFNAPLIKHGLKRCVRSHS